MVLRNRKKHALAELVTGKANDFPRPSCILLRMASRSIISAPAVIAVANTGDLIRHGSELFHVDKETARDFFRTMEIQSSAAAVENLLLAATALGLGSVWLGILFLIKDEVLSFLGEPEGEFMAVIPVGYAAKAPEGPEEKARRNHGSLPGLTYTSHVTARWRWEVPGIMSNLALGVRPFRWQGLVLLGGILLAYGFCSLGVPVPRWDDGIYKSPGAELAQHGRMIVPAAQGFLPQADRVFAAYPPLYQLAIAGWYLAFGVSLRSSLAFSFTLHLLGMLGVMAVTGRLVRASLNSSADATCPPARMQQAAAILVVAAGLIHLADLSHFDRPEEAALLWIWLEMLAVHHLTTRPGWLRGLASGLLLGLAALTAPWVGFVGALIVSLRALFTAVQCAGSQRLQRWLAMIAHLAIAAVTAAAMAGIWYALMERAFPGAVRRRWRPPLVS